MARGAASKEIITQKILDTFPGSFLYDKEIRIPMDESGDSLQIKCVLTCAKANVSADGDDEIPFIEETLTPPQFSANAMNKPTDEEKATVDELLKKLGL